MVAALLVLALRRAVLRRRGRSPRVQIKQFGWTGSEADERQAIWITSKFREQLSLLQLDPLDAIPDRAPGAPLVQIVEGVGQGVAHGLDVGRAIGRLWLAAVPDSAYEVWATLRPQDDEKGSISVQLIRRAAGNQTLINFTTKELDWEASAREAAVAVAGALYPRVANDYKGPWTKWREPVPADLIEQYQSGLEAEVANRPEQAMGAFRAALIKDPLNPHLRLKVAMLEERLDLHLDAWFTYRAIVAEEDRDLWKGPDRRVRLLALYRLAIHLWNPRVAEQWVEADEAKTQKEHREALRKLRKALLVDLKADPLFKGRLWERQLMPARGSAAQLIDALVASWFPGSSSKEVLLGPFESTDRSDRGRKEKVRRVLQVLSLSYLEEMEGRMRALPPVSLRHPKRRHNRRPPLARWWQRREFSPMTIRVSERLVRLRIAAGVEAQLATSNDLDRVQNESASLVARWPFPADGLLSKARRSIQPRLWWSNRRDDAWQLHYNAACTVATVLLDGSILEYHSDLEAKRNDYARAARKQLEEYAHRANSGRVAGKADWLAFEDPDLEALVSEPEFRLWAARHLGFEVPAMRTERAKDIERYTARVVQQAAVAFAASWQKRAAMDSVAAATLVGWWREEEEIWRRLHDLCCQHQSWKHRLRALRALEGWQAANGLAVADLAYDVPNGATPPRKVPTTLFLKVAKTIDGGGGSVLSWAGERAKQVHSAHEEGLRVYRPFRFAVFSKDEREMAARAARTWSLLAEAIDVGLKGKAGHSPPLTWEELLARIPELGKAEAKGAPAPEPS